MDMNDGAPHPQRGDRMRTTKTLYYVLHSRLVKRRVEDAVPRAMLFVEKADDLEQETRNALLRSAVRRRGSYLYRFAWYPRKKKKMTFEQYMGGR